MTTRQEHTGTRTALACTGIAGLGIAGFIAGAGAALFSIALDSHSPISIFANKHRPSLSQFDKSWRHHDAEATHWFTQTQQMVSIPSNDGLTLRAWQFDPDCAHPMDHCYAIVMHGYSGEPEETAPWAYHYAQLGFTVLTPAQRAHDMSQGRYVTMGVHEHEDVLNWIAYIIRQDPQAHILLHGNSMGAASVVLASAQLPESSHCVAAVVDSSYTNGFAQLQQSMAEVLHAPFALAHPIVSFTNLLLRARAHANLHETDCVKAVSRAPIPMIFLQGALDGIVNPKSAQILHDAYQGPYSSVRVFPDAVHTAEVEADTHTYWNYVDDFLQHYFPIRSAHTSI